MFEVLLHNPEVVSDISKDVWQQNIGNSLAYSDAQIAASMCYQPSIREAFDKHENIPVKSGLFETGHHTTMQHARHYLSFLLDKVPVSTITFGLHLVNPFYNSSQRSGRYCTSMFKSDYQSYLWQFIDKYLQNVETSVKHDIVGWVNSGVNYFQDNIEKVTEKALLAIGDERPHYSGNALLQAQRIAQEQLRNVISTIFPTGMMHTISLTTLLGMYECAWNGPLDDLLTQMCKKVFTNDEKLSQLWDERAFTPDDSWAPEFLNASTNIIYNPVSTFLDDDMPGDDYLEIIAKYHNLLKGQKVNTLPFDPRANCIIEQMNTDIRTQVMMSTATFGQDQRHRTVRRGLPSVTGDIYLPPLLQESTHERFFMKHMSKYHELIRRSSTKNMIHFIPYGAVVSYTKQGDLKAFYHETRKRLCINAQEEIWRMSNQTINQMFESGDLNRPGPPCITSGKCQEGKRFCGRDLQKPIKRILI